MVIKETGYRSRWPPILYLSTGGFVFPCFLPLLRIDEIAILFLFNPH